jgi:hypothetical protein
MPPKTKPASAKGRQGGEYEPPILAEPTGGRVPGRGAGVRHMPGKHNQQKHGDGVGKVLKAVSVIRGRRGGTMTVTASRGRMSVRIPRTFEAEGEPDTIDVPVDAAMVREFAEIAETVRQHQARVRQAIKKMDAAQPGTSAHQQAQNEFFELSGDGQRVASGSRPGDRGELHYDVIFEDEDQPTYRFAIRPADADTDWDIDEAVNSQDGGIDMTAAGFRTFRDQLAAA